MNEDTGTCMTPEQAMRAENAGLRAENEELKAICRDKPDHSDLDAAAFQVNMLRGALSTAEARTKQLEAALEAMPPILRTFDAFCQVDHGGFCHSHLPGKHKPCPVSVARFAIMRTMKPAAAALKGDADADA